MTRSFTKFRAKKGEEKKDNALYGRIKTSIKESIKKSANECDLSMIEYLTQLALIHQANSQNEIFVNHFNNLLKKEKA